MKFTRKNTSDTEVALSIVLDAADLSQVETKTLGRLAQKLKVAGFRPGKVPPAVAKKNLDPNALAAEVAEDAINRFMIEVMEGEKLQPLDRPKVEVAKHVPGQELEFTATVPVLPAIKLGDYKKLKAKKTVAKVEPKDIDEVIERMQRGMAEKQPVERAAKDGDEVTIDFTGTKDGQDVPGASGKDYPLNLGSSTFIPGFEEGLVGKKTGDTFDLPLTFPKDYHHKPLAGEKVTFAVTVKEVKEIALPRLDDDFAAKAGPFKTVGELRTDVERELAQQKEREASDLHKDALIEQLVKASDVPVPELLISDQIANLERDFTQNLMYRGMTLAQYLDEQKLTKDEWRDNELHAQAVRRVQVGLVLSELSKAEAVEITADELNARLTEMLQQYGNDPKIREQLDTPEVRRDLANRLITEKTVDRLVALNSAA